MLALFKRIGWLKDIAYEKVIIMKIMLKNNENT